MHSSKQEIASQSSMAPPHSAQCPAQSRINEGMNTKPRTLGSLLQKESSNIIGIHKPTISCRTSGGFQLEDKSHGPGPGPGWDQKRWRSPSMCPHNQDRGACPSSRQPLPSACLPPLPLFLSHIPALPVCQPEPHSKMCGEGSLGHLLWICSASRTYPS